MSVYFIRCGNHIKIGKSDNPWSRIASLQTGSPEALEMLAISPGGVDFERGVQESFAADRVRGEWYAPSNRLMDFIGVVRSTFPELQEAPVVKVRDRQSETALELEVEKEEAFERVGETSSFRMTHKGHYRSPGRVGITGFEDIYSFYYGGYWQTAETSNSYLIYATGLKFYFDNEQYITIERVGDVADGRKNRYQSKKRALEGALNEALKNAIYNRKNFGPCLGVYNDKDLGIVIEFRKEPGRYPVRLDVPEEVIAHWRTYEYKSPLPEGVSIEA